MQQAIKLKYFIAALNIGLASWREAYIFSPAIGKLNLKTYKRRVIYRRKGLAITDEKGFEPTLLARLAPAPQTFSF